MSEITNTAPALARAAEALLRALGGETVSLVFPVVADTNDLGLGAALTEEIAITPVVVRSLTPADNRARREFLLPAAAVAAQIELRGADSADALFQSALGVSHQGRLLHIASVTPESFGGSAYLYRVTAIE